MGVPASLDVCRIVLLNDVSFWLVKEYYQAIVLIRVFFFFFYCELTWISFHMFKSPTFTSTWIICLYAWLFGGLSIVSSFISRNTSCIREAILHKKQIQFLSWSLGVLLCLQNCLLLDTSLDEVYWPCSHSRQIPSFPSQLEWKIGLPWANTRGILNSPS